MFGGHNRIRLVCSIGLLTLLLAVRAEAGGSGLNTVVIVNQSSSNSCEVGNYFCERRQVPPENVLRISWPTIPGNNISWTNSAFQTNIVSPLLAMLVSRQLSNQIDYVVLSMDIPYRTVNGSQINSTTASLFYGPKLDYGPDWLGVTNSYAASEQIFSKARPASAKGYSFLTVMITADTVAQAKNMIDQGVASDGTFPNGSVLLAKSTDPLRNVRYKAFDNAVFNTRLGWNYSIVRTNLDSIWGSTNVQGYQNGLCCFVITPNTFAPGAMADSLTSYGGALFGQTDQTTLLALIYGGASGSYGTVTEPSPTPVKFPDPQNYFYQARGFSLAECYYQSLQEPYEGLIVAEPLAAPCRLQGFGQWTGISSNAVLSGLAQSAVQFSARDAQHPLQQIDLFVDGKYARTVTNLGPASGNVLSIAINGYPISYIVPANATISNIVMDLSALINIATVTNATRTTAFARGDRIELQSTSTNSALDPFYFADSAAGSASSRVYRVAYVPDTGGKPRLTAMGRDTQGAFRMHLDLPVAMPCVIQASSDLSTWTPIFTNALGSSADIFDTTAKNFSRRYYRAATTPPAIPLAYLPGVPTPVLSKASIDKQGNVQMHGTVADGLLAVVEASTDLKSWVPVYTNWVGGALDFVDPAAPHFSRRFYRLRAGPPDPRQRLSALGKDSSGFKGHVDAATTQPYVVQTSSDLRTWTSILTNVSGGSADFIDTQATSSPRRYYRTLAFSQATATPSMSLVSSGVTGNVIRVDPTTTTYTIQFSTNLNQWTSLFTGGPVAQAQLSAASDRGTAPALSTFLTASRNAFLSSVAQGYQSFTVNGIMNVGTWLNLAIWKTNGTQISVSATNTSLSGTPATLVQQLFNAINSTSALTNTDGVSAEDFATGVFGDGDFTVRARAPGLAAAMMQVNLTGASTLVITPATQGPLMQNLSDLRPRNNLFVTAGTTNLAGSFALDTSTLSDGYHELAAVAYEGSHVRTQTRVTMPVRVQNSGLSATMTLVDLSTNSPVQGTYHIQVSANTNNVSLIRLYGTGGVLSSATNQNSATFSFNGSALGAGLHTFYAIVDTATGRSYRTAKQTARLGP